MPFPIPSMAETRDLVVALGKALFSGLNFTSRRSWHGKRATFWSGGITQVMFHADSAQRDLHPLTAGDGKPINDWGSTVGVERKEATPARKSSALRIRGAAGSTVPANRQLKDGSSGLLFKVPSPVTIPGVFGVDPDGFFDSDIVGVDTGSQTRIQAGTVLNFLASPPGIENTAVVQIDVDEDGFDGEQFGSYRGRVLSTFSEARAGGNQADFVRWALESLNTVNKAFAYPLRAGKGTVDIVAFYAGSGTSRSLSSDDRDAVTAYIRTKAPFQIAGDGGSLRVLETIADPQRVEILIEPNGVSAFDFDWDDSAAPTVLAWTAGTRELQFSGGALPTSLRAGHRLVLDGVASAQDGAELKIEAVSGVDKVILAVAPTVAPAATDKIYSGGPLVTPIRDAIVAHLNGEIVYAGRGLTPIPESKANQNGQSIIGLDILADGVGPANPAGRYGTWSGGILLASLFGIVKYKAGVRNLTIVSPATDYEAVDDAFPLDDQIHYVTPGAVIIRSAG
jgi:uncharacterized phage protein gp47/JayE